MPRKEKGERLVSVSVSILPSLLDRLDLIAYEKRLPSRSNLIAQILTNWADDYQKKKANKRSA